MVISKHLYIKKGKKYFPATPGQVTAECIELLHELKMHDIASDLSQRILDLQIIRSLRQEFAEEVVEHAGFKVGPSIKGKLGRAEGV